MRWAALDVLFQSFIEKESCISGCLLDRYRYKYMGRDIEMDKGVDMQRRSSIEQSRKGRGLQISNLALRLAITLACYGQLKKSLWSPCLHLFIHLFQNHILCAWGYSLV